MRSTGAVLREGFNYAPEKLGDVLVLGLGVSGKAVASYALDLLGSRVESLVVAAGPRTADAALWARTAETRGARVLFDTETIEGSYDLCVASPGISQFSSFYENASRASLEVISEVEFAWRECPSFVRWVAITGTNGKTTTTALTAHVLRSCGMNVRAVGNIGDTCIEAVASGGADVLVAEVSSYQLASTLRFAPQVAVVLNITPDHLSWHKSHKNYAQAKWKVLDNLSVVRGSVAVLNASDDEVRAKIRSLRAMDATDRGFSYVPVGTAQGVRGDMREACGSDNAAFVDVGGMLHVSMGSCDATLAAASDLQVKGDHNLENALAASCAALALGVDPSHAGEALATFAPLAHRIEFAGEVGGVACYNDSKATNVDAVLKALSAFGSKKPLVLLGGRDKGTDLAPLVAACAAHAKAVVCFGEARDRFAADLSDVLAASGVFLMRARTMEEALDAALDAACAGDVVLLSPACASFDEFSCFEERGDAFKELVRVRAERLAR